MFIQMLINNLRAISSQIQPILKENQLKEIIENAVTNDFTKDTKSKYPYLTNKNMSCDLKLRERAGGAISWVEFKKNITLLPIGSCKIIYEMNKLIFLDIARLIVGVNNQSDVRLIVANINRELITDYYRINPDQIIETLFTAEDILPVSKNRMKFVEMKLEAKIKMHFLNFCGGYLMVAQILDGYASINIYKNLENKDLEGECQKKSYVEVDDNNKQVFFRKYFPAS